MARRQSKPARPAAAKSLSKNPSATARLELAPWQWWLLCAALPIFLLASRLTLDLWGDEVYTIYDFAAQPISRIVSDYSAPNNHILYSLVLHPLALRTQAEPLLRLPSFLCAVGTLALVFRVAQRCAGITAAVSATLALGLNMMFLTHAVQVRGYSLSMLLVAVLMYVALPRESTVEAPAAIPRWRSDRARYVAIAFLGAAFVYVIPSNVIFLAPLALAAVLMNWPSFGGAAGAGPRRFPWQIALSWLAAFPLALFAYWPVLAQVRSAAGGAGAPLTAQSLVELVRDVYWAAGHDLLPLVIAVPVVVFRVASAWRAARTGEGVSRPEPRAMMLLATALLIAPFLICWALGMAPFVRNFCPLLPAFAVTLGWFICAVLGDQKVLSGRPDTRRALPWLGMLLVAAVLLPAVLRYTSRLDFVRTQRFAQDGYYNYYAADFEPSRVARYLGDAIQPDEDFIVLYADGDQYNLAHYLARAGLPLPPKRLTESSPGKARARVFCVVPELAKWDELAEIVGLSAKTLRKYPLVTTAGYYRVYASPGPVELDLANFGKANTSPQR